MNQYSSNFKTNLIKLLDNVSIIMQKYNISNHYIDFNKSCLELIDEQIILSVFLKEYKSFFISICNMDDDLFILKLKKILGVYVTDELLNNILNKKYDKESRYLIWNYIYKLFVIGINYLILEDINNKDLETFLEKIRIKLEEIDNFFST